MKDFFKEVYDNISEESIINMENKYIMNTYGRYPIAPVKGSGIYLEDVNGKKYVDFLAGISVNNIGHCHPEMVNAVKKQLETLIHVSNLYYIIPQVKLGEKLVQLSGLDKVFFSNSGAEANEAAIKLVRRYGKLNNIGEGEIIGMTNCFHGRTLATITATGKKKYLEGYDPLPEGFKHAIFNDLESLKETISSKTTGIIIEPVQGEGGINICDKEYLKGVKDICDDKNIILIFDEVQCGLGRTGRMFAYEHYGVKPDVLTLAKALGGGIPIGATLSTEEISKAFTLGTHGTTFGGNPLACMAGYATVNIIEELLPHVNEVGEYFLNKLKVLKKYDFVKDIRGLGLMIGVELSFNGNNIVNKMLEKGYLINCTSDTVLRFLPPLIIDKKDVDDFVKALDEVMGEVEGNF